MTKTIATPKHKRTLRKVSAVAAIPTILLGFVCYLVANQIDGGFIGGFFQGATIALMVFGAYLLGASVWSGRKSGNEPEAGNGWLPSRDSAVAVADADPIVTRAENE